MCLWSQTVAADDTGVAVLTTTTQQQRPQPRWWSKEDVVTGESIVPVLHSSSWLFLQEKRS